MCGACLRTRGTAVSEPCTARHARLALNVTPPPPPERPCFQALALTRDQTADREDERQRVEAAGGTVSHVLGGWRVGAVGMQVTR